MRTLFPLLKRLAETDISVLIEGNTGTGKGEVACALHAHSSRAAKPFVIVDCTLLPEALAPSLLFGHERGAFTGAVERRIGAFESAQGGVLFLDEVGELSPAVQAMLLRAVQYREITPVGSSKRRSLDLRVFSATWRDLRSMVNSGTFREDLYYRLAGASVYIPPLSKRIEDIPLLAQRFLSRLPSQAKVARSLSPEVVAALSQRRFRGNVRELLMLVDRLAHLASGPTITLNDLEMEQVLSGLRDRAQVPSRAFPTPAGTEGPSLPLYLEARQSAMEDFELQYLRQLVERAGGNLSRAAALAGIQRKNLRALLRKHGLYGTPSAADQG
jgi:DNA-binding NtrC family response regulator